jgi:hypothetical protein
MRPQRGLALDLACLVALKAALGALVLRLGFSHVSDDDYARVVIAELFVHTPRLDPSATSWLPFPFWLNGAVMMVLGRSLEVARGIALGSGLVGVAAVYVALRAVEMSRACAAIAVVLAMATPWNAWLGVATVPEGLTGALIAAGAITVARPSARPWGAVALLVAALSRYEAWPVCAFFAVCCAWSSAKNEQGRAANALAACVAAAGPLLWMTWNAHAHGSALHFLARVVAYRQHVDPSSIADKLVTFPRAVVVGAPEIAAVAGVGALGLGDPQLRTRWGAPLAAAVGLLAFLVYGDLHDGAPTHHPERALIGVWWILAGFGVDGVRAFVMRVVRGRAKREAFAVAMATGGAVAWLVSAGGRLREFPGRGADEGREVQIARGAEMREMWRRSGGAIGELGPGQSAVEVMPCRYEHFAMLAAWGEPERATVIAATNTPVTADCPHVTTR